MSAKGRRCPILEFGVDFDCLPLDLQEISTSGNSDRLQGEDDMAHEVFPLQNEVSATL